MWLEAVKSYLARQTDYALMIEGEWGSGKTYSFKNHVLPLIEGLGMNPIYVSLFGLSTVEQVSRSLLSATWIPEKVQGVIESKAGRTISELGKILVSTAAGIPQLMHGVKFPNMAVNFESFLFLKNKTVLCFDDVERCKINSGELLGFINKFLENDQLKVIFIANGNKVDQEFNVMKEKLVRLTVRYEPNIDEVVPTLIRDITNEEEGQIGLKLRELQPEIIRFIKNADLKNIRTLKYAIDIIWCVLNEIDTNDLEDIENVQLTKLINFTIAVSNEVMIGSDQIREFEDYIGNEEFQQLYYAAKRKSDEDEKTYIQKFADKYFNGGDTNLVFSASVLWFILDGVLNKNLLQLEFKRLLPKKLDNIELLSCGQWFVLGDEDFKNTISEFRHRIKNGQLPIQSYPNYYLVLISILKKGIANFSLKDLEKDFKAGMELALEKSKYVLLWPTNSPEHYHLSQEEREIYDQIINCVSKINNELKLREHQTLIDSISEHFEENFDLFLEKVYSNGFMTMEQDIPFLKLLGVDFLFSKLTSISNENLYRMKLYLEERFKFYKLETNISEEIPVIDELMDRLKSIVDEGSGTVKKVLIEEMYNYWESISTELNKK